MIKHYSSLTEFLDLARPSASRYTRHYAWDAGISGVKAIDLARNGDPSLVKVAEMVTDKIEIQTLETEEAQFIPSQYGRRPHVPSFIAGNPLSMRRRVRTHTEGKVVNVCVNLASAGVISSSDMLTRGAAIVGLISALQRSQARVELALTYGMRTPMGERWDMIHVDSTPVDLSVLGFAMAHPAFARNVVMQYSEAEGSYSGATATRNLDDSPNDVAAYLGLTAGDVYIPRANLDTMSAFNDPVAWVQSKLTQVASS